MGLILSYTFERQIPYEVTQDNHDTWVRLFKTSKTSADQADKFSYTNELGKSKSG